MAIVTAADPLRNSRIRIHYFLQNLAHDWYIGSVGSHKPGTRPIFLPIGGPFSHPIRIRHTKYNNPDPTLPSESGPRLVYRERRVPQTRDPSYLFTYRGPCSHQIRIRHTKYNNPDPTLNDGHLWQ